MYVKLFETLLNSSIMESDLHVRWVWIVLLLMADREGMVVATDIAISRRANLSLEETQEALHFLQQPDPNSTTPDLDGQRIITEGPNTWWLVNYLKYRELKDKDQQREATRRRVARHRERYSNGGVLHVTPCNPIADAEAEADTDTKKREGRSPQKRQTFKPPSADEVTAYLAEKNEHRFSAETFVDHYASKGWMIGKNRMRDWRAAVRTWIKRKDDEGVPQPGAGSDGLSYEERQFREFDEAHRLKVQRERGAQ